MRRSPHTLSWLARAAGALRNLAAWLTVAWLGACASAQEAQPPAVKPPQQPATAAPEVAEEPRLLWEEDPFDLITLTPDQQSAQLKVIPLTIFPGRVPPPRAQWPAAGALKFKLPDKGGKEFEVNWAVIATIEPFEKLLIDEAAKRTAAGDFDKAYACYELLQRRYSNYPGVKDGIERFLFLHAADSYKKKRYDEALSLLEDAFQMRRENPPVIRALELVTSALIEGRIKAGRFRDAREIIDRTEQHFGEALKPIVDRFRGQLQADAGALLKEAADQFTAGKLRDAYLTARRMHVIWPGLPGAADLQAKIAAAYPAVSIGVTEAAPLAAKLAWPSWSQRRVSPLLKRPLVVFQSPGVEGGIYQSPLGKLELTPDGKQLLFSLPQSAKGPSGYEVAAKIAALADRASADYAPGWGELLKQVQVLKVRDVEIDLRRASLRPEAWLLPLDFAAPGSPGAVVYKATAEPNGNVRYFWPEGTPTPNPAQPHEIEERQFADSQAAIESLERGEIDAVDRLLPAMVRRVAGQRGLTVRPYAVPTVHAIVPNVDRPWTANRSFRRALVYALDREQMVRQKLCGGGDVPGCRVVSGPFPAGIDQDDFAGYAHHPQIAPRPFDPRLAAALRYVSEGELAEAAKRSKKDPPRLAPLKLVYPPTEIARLTAPILAAQWKGIGIECETEEVPDVHAPEVRQKADLRFVELNFVEPLVEASLVFGPEGPLATMSPYVQRSLDRVQHARNWSEARERLRELHRLAHEEVLLVPLWQVIEHSAFRSDLQGPTPKLNSLYQNIENWKIAPTASP